MWKHDVIHKYITHASCLFHGHGPGPLTATGGPATWNSLPVALRSSDAAEQDISPARRFASGTSYVPVSVCLSVCHKPVLYRKRSSWFLAQRLLSVCSTWCCEGTRTSPKIRTFRSGTLSQTQDLEEFRNYTSTVASVVNSGTLSVINWRRSSVASLSL